MSRDGQHECLRIGCGWRPAAEFTLDPEGRLCDLHYQEAQQPERKPERKTPRAKRPDEFLGGLGLAHEETGATDGWSEW